MPGFQEQVREYAGRKVPGWALDAAVAEHHAGGRGALDVQECAQLARRISTSYEASAVHLTTPGQLLHSDRLAAWIRPEVERTRRAIFEHSAAPLRSLESAARWVLKTHRDSFRPPSAHARARAAGLLQDAQAKAREAAQLLRQAPGNAVPIDIALPFINGSAIDHVPAPPGSALGILQETVASLAPRTGFAPHALVAFILVGIEPVLPLARVRVQRDLGGSLPPRLRVTLELFARDVTFAQLHALYRRLRGQLGATRKKGLSERHRRLAALVDELGGEPSPGRRGRPPAGRSRGGTRLAFWEGVRREWNQRHQPPYRTWRGLEMLYRRLQARGVACTTRNFTALGHLFRKVGIGPSTPIGWRSACYPSSSPALRAGTTQGETR